VLVLIIESDDKLTEDYRIALQKPPHNATEIYAVSTYEDAAKLLGQKAFAQVCLHGEIMEVGRARHLLKIAA